MEAAIKAAVVSLLIIVLLVVVAVIVKTIYDRQKPLMLRGSRESGRKKGIGVARTTKTLPSTQNTEDEDFGEKKSVFKPRFAFLETGVVAILATLFVKLWSMQLINSESYAKRADSNRTTTFTTRAVRGRIFDRNGVELIGNRMSLAVVADADVANNRNVVHRLSNVLGIPRQAIRQSIRDDSERDQAKRVVATEVPMRAVDFIEEHPGIFPGVSIESRTVRTYPQGDLACHVLGYTGAISAEQLEESQVTEGISYEPGDIVGKSGVELAFESVLQGVRGVNTVEVDAKGNVVSQIDQVAPQAGKDIRLTIDVDIQRTAEEALYEGLQRAQDDYKMWDATAGAVICLDLEDGGVLAMASYPTYSPSKFIGGITSELWESLTSPESGQPLNNRCISGLYPAASTIKPFASMTALKHGIVNDGSTWVCKGVWTELGEQWAKKCWSTSGHGRIDLPNALRYSCDIAFYNISLNFYRNRAEEPNALQDGLMEWGFGSKTGFELTGEAVGRIPTAAWKAAYNVDTPEYATWLPGDMANLIIGQGDVLITPLQNAVAYSGIAIGKCVKPHVLKEVLSSKGEVLISKGMEYSHEPEYNEDDLSLVRYGLRLVARENGYIRDFPITTAGKTGTAEVAGKDDFGWYVGYAPAGDPKYLVVALLEQAGFGGTICPPVVRKVLAKCLGIEDNVEFGAYVDESR
ncbi:MAG: penicillin-binding protein 2 [Coriobacteriales bacterium]|nr:penicillin-binding protein 2 [Coriobacteriales bacterium]